jgi:predicted extracellular nuclease
MERSESESFDTNTDGDPTNPAGEQTGAENGGVSGRVKSVAGAVKQKASTIPSMLADGLEAGALALRQNKPAATSASNGSSVSVASDSSIATVTDTIADGMQSSAQWLRDADLDKLKTGVEKQVKEHPARSLLVALGAGYLIGKALRR